MSSTAQRWRDELAAWAIPPDILAAAPEPPWGFPVALFHAHAESPDTPSRDRALEALPEAGDVLDVGCGGGAAGLALVPPAGMVVGVDQGADLLDDFSTTAAARGVAHRAVLGSWPDVAAAVEPADVVVCHHVLYNIADLPAFVAALTSHARRRVVVELTATHPLATSRTLWQHFHGIDRPTGPTADLAVHVLREAGIEPSIESWQRPPRDVPREVYVELNRRRLCLPASADAEIDRVMGPTTWPRDVVTLWWDVSRPGA
ncbi:MAG TPA: methyltransferase domain-containing protein [Mycobacteriales bacterium]|nr:methyltransferase domain-containing protein [Mycobacteriales bacterium]